MFADHPANQPNGTKTFAFISDVADAFQIIWAKDEDEAYAKAITSFIVDFGLDPLDVMSVREAAILFARHCQLLPLCEESPVCAHEPYSGEIPEVDADDKI